MRPLLKTIIAIGFVLANGCRGGAPAGPTSPGISLLPPGQYVLEVQPFGVCGSVAVLHVRMPVQVARVTSAWIVRLRDPSQGNLELRLEDGEVARTGTAVAGTASGRAIGQSVLDIGAVEFSISGAGQPLAPFTGDVTALRGPNVPRAFGQASGAFAVVSARSVTPCAFEQLLWRIRDP